MGATYYEDTENQQSVQVEDNTLDAIEAEETGQSVQPASVQAVQPQKMIQPMEAVLNAIQKNLPLIVVSAAVVAGFMYFRKNRGK